MKQIPFKKLLVVVLVVLLSGCSKEISNSDDPLNSHNGISFDMSQKDVGVIGFVCQPRNETSHNIVCYHMDMTGVAFGFPTKDYHILFGPNGKILEIVANFSHIPSTSDYFSLESKIGNFFPTKIELEPIGPGVIREEWRAKNNAKVSLIYLENAPPVVASTLTIYFSGPEN